MKNIDESVEQYFDKYRDYLEFYETKSTVAKTRGVTNEDLWALGSQLDAYTEFQSFTEANGGYGDLGVLPNIALDVITASTALSPIPLFASVQPLQEQKGTIYFKNIVAENTRGNITDNDVLVNAKEGRKIIPSSYAGEELSEVVVASVTVDAVTWAGTLGTFPVRKREVEVDLTLVGPLALKLIDDGLGNLIGVTADGTASGYGTIDYEYGTWEITTTAAGLADATITCSYATNFEALTEIPTIRSEYESITVQAKTFALRSDIGLFKSFSLGKRFGINVEETMARDLTQELTTEVASNVVLEAYLNSTGVTDWLKTPPTSVSYTEHKLTFFDALAGAESTILSNAGRSGGATALLASFKASAIIRTLPGFKPAGDLNAVLGTHFFGTLDGKPVLRSQIIPDEGLDSAGSSNGDNGQILMVSKGTSMFDTSVVYAPYLPLFVTNMADGIDHNPLKSQKGVALQAGMAAPVPTLITKIVITA